jgi:hypothetical protein
MLYNIYSLLFFALQWYIPYVTTTLENRERSQIKCRGNYGIFIPWEIFTSSSNQIGRNLLLIANGPMQGE